MDARHEASALQMMPVWAEARFSRDVAAVHREFLNFLGNHSDWSFWHHWYCEMWEGDFRDWSLATQVALIPNEVWEGEDAVANVAAAIREIKVRNTADQAQTTETLILNETTYQYAAHSAPTSNTGRLRRHLSRVEDALDDIIALSGGNGMTANTAEFRIIKRLVQKYADDPERVAFDLTDANKSIARQIRVGEYADDEPLRLLQAANAACIAFVCGTHEEVADELARGLEPEPQMVTQEDGLVLDEAWRLSEAMLDHEAAQTTREDKTEIMAGQIIDAAVDPMPEWSREAHAMRSIVLRRQISRMWQQAQGLATIEGLATAYDGKVSKAIGVVGRVGLGVGILYQAILILGRMLGL